MKSNGIKMKYSIIKHLVLLTAGVLFVGCSELETNIEVPETNKVHVKGVLDSSSPEFHGKIVGASGWNVRACQQCHGESYKGSFSGPTCLTCHNQTKGPENCSTCHGSSTSSAPPRDLSGNTVNTARGVGAHQVHLAGTLRGKSMSCAECHIVPGDVYTEGHLDGDSRAEVIMANYLANIKTNDPSTSQYDAILPLFVPNPAYNLADQTCANTYCHGNFKNGNTNNKPVWNDPATGTCGTCHGDPTRPTLMEKALPKTIVEGGTHPEALTCSQCHGGVVNANLNFINPSKHMDGLLNLRNTSGQFVDIKF